MYNKKTLSKAKAELDKAKAPAKPKDIITDPMGQWKYPGLPTRIPGNNITMEGVGYPVLGVANNGQRKIMLPGADYTFPGAQYVDEYPQMKKGGTKKKRKTKSIMGMNKLMQKGPLFQDYSKRIYDPNVNYFQKGGPQNTSGPRNIQSSYDYDDQQFHQNDPVGYDEFINGPGHAPDTYKFSNHPTFSNESMYSNEETPGGEWMKKPDGSWKFKASSTNRKNMSKEEMQDYFNNVEPGNELEYKDGGIYINLTDDEIDQYRKGGYIVEDISVPELNQAQEGKTVKNNVLEISDPKEFAYRKAMYDDSLDLYNYSNKQIADKTKRFGSDAVGVKKEYNKKKAAEFLKEQLKTYGDLAHDPKDKYGKLITKLVKKSNISPIGLSINVEDYDYIFKKPAQKVVLKEEKPKFETKTSGHTYEDSLKTYNNYLKRKEAFDNIKSDTFKSYKEFNDFQKKIITGYPTDYNLALKEELPRKKVKFQNGESSIIQIAQYKKPTGSKPAKQSKYPEGYQPYSLYGKVLDPEVYGYAESLNGKPVQIAQFADTYGHKAKMDAYRKSGNYPWVKQKGGESKVILTKEHTDKKGNKTIVVTKDDGTKYTKVISKDGKVYNNTQAGLPPEMREYFRKQAEWEDRSSGAAQPVDDFWTLPIGMTSAGVKGAVGLAKGLTSLGRNAAKSSLVQSGRAGVKQLMNAAPKSLPGANLKNLLNSAFITSGINNYIDQNSDVRRATKKAYDNPTFDNVGEALGENTWNALNFSGLNVGKGVKQLGKYTTTLPGKLSKTKANSIPKRATSIGLDTYSGDSFTPIRKYSKEIFDNVGDFDYKQFSEGDEALKKLKSAITSEPIIGKADVYSNAELQKKIQNYKNWRNEIDEIFKEYKKLDPSGNSSNSDLRNLHPHLKKRWNALKDIDKSITDKFITKEQEKLIRENYPELIPTLDTRNDLSRSSLKKLGENKLPEPMPEEAIDILKSLNLYKKPNKNLLRFEPGKMNKLGGLVKAQKGAIVLKLNSKEIQDYIKQGYIVEDVD